VCSGGSYVSLCFGKSSGEAVILAMLEGSSLVRLSKSLLPGRGSAVPFYGGLLFLPPCEQSIISAVLPGFQGDCKVTTLSVAQSKECRHKNGGRGARLFSCF
jgi:hypothetical protein